MTTIGNLPVELLDEIFSYTRPLNDVCRRWNRPRMTRKLLIIKRAGLWIESRIETFPKLVSLTVSNECPVSNEYPVSNECRVDHAYLKELIVTAGGLPVMHCPRLTSLSWTGQMTTLFNYDVDYFDNLISLLNSLSSLTLVLQGPGSSVCDRTMHEYLDGVTKDYAKHRSLKCLSLDIQVPEIDPDDLFYLFASPRLETLSISYGGWLDWSTLFEVFPIISSLKIPWDNGVRDQLKDFVQPLVTSLELEDTAIVRSPGPSLSLLIRHFPNLLKLSTQGGSPLFDISCPTKLTHLQIFLLLGEYTSPPIQFALFPHLKELQLELSRESFHELLVDLSTHCHGLEKLTLVVGEGDTSLFDPDFEGITFPKLISIELQASFVFNESMTRFIGRHPSLESLVGGWHVSLLAMDQPHLQVLPRLKLVELDAVEWSSSSKTGLYWILLKAPKLCSVWIRSRFDRIPMDEPDFASLWPRLTCFSCSGMHSISSLQNWTRVGSWTRSLSELTLDVPMNVSFLRVLFEFLRAHSRLESLRLLLHSSDSMEDLPDQLVSLSLSQDTQDELTLLAHEFMNAYDNGLTLEPILYRILYNRPLKISIPSSKKLAGM